MTISDLVSTREPAWVYLLEQRICTLPIDAFTLAYRNGYKILSYANYSALTGRSVEFLIKNYDKDGFVFWSDKLHKYIICYNEKMSSDVIRWTLMHEIAHIVLKHVTPAIPVLKRIRGEDRPTVEGLADSFARRVLCPSIVLHACHAIEPNSIAELCGISPTAAEFRARYMKVLEKRNRFLSRPLELKVYQQFRAFIENYNSRKFGMELADDFFEPRRKTWQRRSSRKTEKLGAYLLILRMPRENCSVSIKAASKARQKRRNGQPLTSRK